MLSFDITSLKYWPHQSDEAYQIKNIHKNKVRRLTKVSKALLDISFEDDFSDPDYVIFSSRHGAIIYSHELIEQLYNKEDCSPIKFSQSVHNADASLYTILKNTNTPVIAIAAGRHSFEMGLLSSLSTLSMYNYKKVIFLYAEPVLPEFYAESLDGVNEEVAMVMSLTRGDRFSLNFESKSESEGAVSGFFKFNDWLDSSDEVITFKNYGIKKII